MATAGRTLRAGVPAQLRYPHERLGYMAMLPEDLIHNLSNLSASVFA